MGIEETARLDPASVIVRLKSLFISRILPVFGVCLTPGCGSMHSAYAKAPYPYPLLSADVHYFDWFLVSTKFGDAAVLQCCSDSVYGLVVVLHVSQAAQ